MWVRGAGRAELRCFEVGRKRLGFRVAEDHASLIVPTVKLSSEAGRVRSALTQRVA